MKNREFDVTERIKARNKLWKIRYDKNPTDKAILTAADEYIKLLEDELFKLECQIATQEITHWPRIRNLPKSEQKDFRRWLSGQTCPLINGVPYEEQDAFYPWDYNQWKKAVKGIKVMWD